MVRRDLRHLMPECSADLQCEGADGHLPDWSLGLTMLAKPSASSSRLPVWSTNGGNEKQHGVSRRRTRSDNRVRFGEVEIMTFRKQPVIQIPTPCRSTEEDAALTSPIVHRRSSKPMLFEKRSRARAYQESMKHVIQEGFAYRKGAYVTYSCVYSFVLDFAPGDVKRAISPKDVLDAVSHAYPKVISKPIERQFCIFVNMEMVEHDSGRSEVIKITKRELSPLASRSDVPSSTVRSPRKRSNGASSKACRTTPRPTQDDTMEASPTPSLKEGAAAGAKAKKRGRSKKLKVPKSHEEEWSRRHPLSSPRYESSAASIEDNTTHSPLENKSVASLRRAEYRLMSLFQGTVSDDDAETTSTSAVRKVGMVCNGTYEPRLPYETHSPENAWSQSESEMSRWSSTSGSTLSWAGSELESRKGWSCNDVRGQAWSSRAGDLDEMCRIHGANADGEKAPCGSYDEAADRTSSQDTPNRYYFSAFLLQSDGRCAPNGGQTGSYLELPIQLSDASRRRCSLENNPFAERRQRIVAYRRHSSESRHGDLDQTQLSIELPSRCNSESSLVGRDQLSFKSNNIPSRDEFGVLTNQTVSVLCRPRVRMRAFTGIPIMQNSTLAHRVLSLSAHWSQQQRQWQEQEENKVRQAMDNLRVAVVKSFSPQANNKITLTEARYHLAKTVDCSVSQLPADDALLRCFFEVFDSFGFEVLTDKVTCIKTVFMLHVKHRRQLLAGNGKQWSLPETESQLLQERQKCRVTGLFSPNLQNFQSTECELRRRSRTSSVESLLIAT